jgi:glycogen phosphorylase
VNFQASQALSRLAYNLRWAWHTPTAQLFGDLAPGVWSATHNPVAVMHAVAQLDELPSALASRIVELDFDLNTYLFRVPRDTPLPRVAYFSAEFALTECLPIYSGGLGVLAGDHLKAASDLGVPLLGIGLLYRYGYFRQTIDSNGWQQEAYDRLVPEELPLRPVFASEGTPLEIGVPLGNRMVRARAWLAQVGRVPLYLLDTDIPANLEDDRWITGHLYGGDSDTRLRQEIVLGIGGARLLEALRVLGLEAAVEACHLNEGHAAFVALERAAQRMRQSGESDFFVAHLQAAESLAFTTHTPVAAGHDAFHLGLMEAYLGAYREELGLSRDEFLSLGRRAAGDHEQQFSMTVLALRSAQARNGVSQLHANVSRHAWSDVGTGVQNATPRIRMDAITNGVHTATWAGPEMSRLLDDTIGCAWRERPQDPSAWTRLAQASPGELWAARGAQRARLLGEIQRRHSCKLDLIDDNPMIVGFARRFATYKRAGLLLRHPAWLERLLRNGSEPLLLVFSGKAHPHDEPGKQLIQRVIDASRDDRYNGRIVFLPDYDVQLARLMVQGSDVWLNTPRRPMEASGTSGMKAALNGALNLSELDGWWDEAYAPQIGWALGEDLPAAISDDARDETEAAQLLQLLETEIVPMFFKRDEEGLPMEWLARVQGSIELLAPRFSAQRMVDEYVTQIYRRLTWQARVPLTLPSRAARDARAA